MRISDKFFELFSELKNKPVILVSNTGRKVSDGMYMVIQNWW